MGEKISLWKVLTLAVFMLAMGQAWAAVSDTTVAGKTYKKIGTCADLVEFSTKINNGTFAVNTNAIVTDNIDCAGSDYTPIGGKQNPKTFTGTFNGNGKVITNLSISAPSGQDFYVGLIAKLGTGGVVKDVVIYDLTIATATSTGKNDYVGGIVGYMVGGTIQTCTVAGASTISARRKIGGIVGYAESGLIEDCLSSVNLECVGTGTINSTPAYVGGICGQALSGVTIQSCVYVGGEIVRTCAENNTCLNVEVDAEHPENSHQYAIAGGDATINDCYYEGSINTPTDKNPYVNGNGATKTDDVNDPEVVCDLNGGTMVDGECYGGDKPWTTEPDITNHGGVHTDDDGTTYKITFDPNGGVFGTDSNVKSFWFDANTAINADSLAANPTREGDEFLGWALTTNATAAVGSYGQATGPTTFYAVWKNSVVITFDANGGKFPSKAVTSKRVNKGDAITADGISTPSAPTVGIQFVGWALTSDATTASALGTASTPITVYAVYAGEFTVSFQSNGGSFAAGATRTKSVKIGAAITADGIDVPNPPTEAYTFKGWSLDQNATAPGSLGTMGFAPVNVYAVWEINYWTISFDPNGGYFDGNTGNTSAVDKPVIKDNTINSEGAYETIEKASLVDTLGCQVYKCKDFKCKQAKCEVPKCQSFYCKVPKCMTFNCKTKKPNGSCKTYYTDADYQTEGYCKTLYSDANTHTDGRGNLDRCYVLYTDNDYQTDGYCKTLYSDANTHTDGKGNLDRCYQQYTDADDNAAHCNAWYNTDTGDQCKTRYSAADGNDEEYCKTWNTKTSEYHFQGWNNDKNATTAIADLGKAKQDSTFYAVWTTDVLYSVNFITAYGTAPETQHVKTGTKATKPSDPTAKGYSFDGWVTTEGGSTAFNFNKNITEATNIYAKWTPNKHTVTFQVLSSIDSSVVSTETVTRTNQAFGSDVELVSKSMEGYTYSDWTSTSDGVTINGSSFKMPDNDVVLTCYRTPETYYLEWNLKNGTITSAPDAYTPEGDVPFGTTINAPDVTRVGYLFQGWTLNGIDIITFPTTMPGEDVSYQALWKAKRYKIDYYVDGVLKKTVSDLAYNSTITPMDTSKVGYDFSGWTWYDGDTEIETPSVIPDFDLKAKGTFTIHKYDVTFNLQGKGENLTAKVEYGSSAVEPSPAPTAEGFAFKGWFKEAACTNAWDFEAGKITTDSTIYAKWTPTHTVTFTVDGSVDNTLTQVVAEGDEVTLTALSDKDAIHTFAGWTMVTDGVTITDGKFTMPAKDVEIAGGFNYTVTYTMDGNAYGEMETYPYGTEVTVKAKVDSTGYTVTDWASAQVTDEDLAAGKFTLTGDVVITATSEIKKFMITFANYDDTELQSSLVEYGTVPEYNGKTPTKAATAKYTYTFKGWDVEPVAAIAAVIYKAQFDSTVNKYEITWKNYDNSVLAVDSVAYDETPSYGGETPEKPATAEKTYTFIGWDPDVVAVTGDAVYTAQFTDVAVSYELAWDFAGGEATGEYTAAGEVLTGATLKYPTSVTKTGYDFAGWEPTSVTVMPAKDLTLTAQWTPVEYTITYVTNDGSAISSSRYTIESEDVVLSTATTKTGYTFAGWYANETLTGDTVMSVKAGSTGNKTFYAKWTIKQYTITFDTKGGSEVAPITQNYGTAVTAPANPTKEHYSFVSWNVAVPATMPAKDTLLTAVWTPDVFSIAYVMNGGEQPADEFKSYPYSETEAFALPSSATYSGWNFAGWYKESAFTNSMTELAAKTFGDTAVYAKFTKEVKADIGDVDGDGKNDTITVVIDNNDTEDSVSVKTTEEAENSEPPMVPADSTKDPYDYTFKEYQCDSAEVGAAVDYTCKAVFDSTAKTYEIVLDIPDSVGVDCDGVAACVIVTDPATGNPTDTTIIHKYGEETILPEAFVVDSTGKKDTTWDFHGWVNTDGDTLMVIPDTAMADTLKPSFTKEVDVVIGVEPDADTIHVVIDNDDTQDSIETKVKEEAEKHVPPLPRDTVIVDTPYVYTYNDSIGFQCEFVNATEMKCEAVYDTTGMEFEIVLDIPDSVGVDCDGITACVIVTDPATGNPTDTTVIHKYGEETILPEAFVVDSTGKKDTTWDFHGWVNTDGDTLMVIPDTAMADTLKPSFTKEVDVVIGVEPDADTIHVVIDNDDTQDSIETKVQEEAEKHVPPLPRDTVIVDTPYVYTYNDSIGFDCKFAGATELKCEAVYDTTGMEFEIVLDIPDSVGVDCDGVAACVIVTDPATGNPTDTTVIHKYGEETILPEAFVVDSTGKKDTTWEFQGWVDSDGDTLMVIPDTAMADTLKPSFTKELDIIIVAEPDSDTIHVVIDNDDTQDSIETKVQEEAEKHVPPLPRDTVIVDTPYVYTYNDSIGFQCEFVNATEMKCEAVYDTTGMEFEIVLVVPDTAIVDCDGIDACKISTDSTGLPIDTTVVHKYGEETVLPEAHVIGDDGKIDSTWEFAGWFDNEDGQGDAIDTIPATAYGDTLYPYFKKEIEVIIGDDTIQVVIDPNDTQDSINTKVKEEAENHVPPIVPNPSTYIEPPYEYTYNGYDCEPAGKNVYVCEATYDSVKVGAQYKIVYMMPKAAVLSKNIKSYTEGVGTVLPTASLKGTDGWQFMGWYIDERFVGTRVQEIKASEKGKKVFYPMFQKTLFYSTRDGSGEISVIYNEAELDMVERTLAGVIPADYEENGVTYTFDKWFEKNGHYTAEYIDASKTGLASRAIANFQVMVSGRSLEISGAKMGAKIAVYGMNGRLVTQGIVEHGTTRVDLTEAGSYVVRVNNQYSRVNIR